ncbi:hypothetical protein NKY39_12095 [Sinorhizobium meliloti]|uniref:hypothetical protein n=1 Tax=Rhizobium meliloti TaxID=382 RepID=UPI003D661AF7
MESSAKWAAFFWGAFGGMLPTVAKLASTFVSTPGTPLPEVGLLLGVALWAIVGGGVALSNTSYETRQAIFAGIAAPAILANLVSGVTGQAAQDERATLFGISAYAQPTDLDGGGGGAIIVSPIVKGGLPRSASLPVTAEVKSGDQTTTVKLGEIKDFSSPTAFSLPPGASQVFVSDVPVATTGTVTNVDVSVTTAPSIGGDLLWALGAPRNFQIKQVDVSPSAPQ